MRRTLIALALLSSGTLLACSLAGDDAASQEADHTAGEPTFSQEPWLWADESDEEFRRMAAQQAADPNNWMGPADFLPAAENALGHLQRSLERLAPETRAALWATLAERAARCPAERRDPMCVRLAEVVAQIDLLRAEVESVRKEVEAGAAARPGRRSAP